MDRKTFLERVRAARAEWERQLARVPAERLEMPGVVGDWSVKDLVAHVVWSEHEMLGLLQARVLAGSDLWNLGTDERNAAVFDQNRGRPAAEVLAEAEAAWQALWPQIQALSDDELNSPIHFRNMPGEWVPWQILDGSTAKHYQEHAADLRAWLAAQGL